MSGNDEFSLTFLPYYITGFLDDIDFKLQINGKTSDLDSIEFESMPILLRGSETILDIHRNMIARTYPARGSNDAETNYFPYIEFVDPDFPWRYSKKENINNYDANQVDPWICLVVLKKDEISGIEKIGPDGREVLIVNSANLPNLEKIWQTASVQLNGFVGPHEDDQTTENKEGINNFIENNPSSHFSRLFCFRLLKPEMTYYAFLVPVFKKALIPYGLTTQSAEKLSGDKIWAVSANETAEGEEIYLPIYYRWSFTTAEQGDFEELIRRIVPKPVDPAKVGTVAVDLSAEVENSTSKPPFFKREGALTTLGFNDPDGRMSYDQTFKNNDLAYAKIKKINEVLNRTMQVEKIDETEEDPGPDPIISYPIYGRWHTKVTELKDTQQWPSDNPWIHELNLDLRYRISAGFGTIVIQNNQEEYMEECWSQVGDLRKANEQLKATKAGFGISKAIFKKQLDPSTGKLTPEQFTLMAAPFHSKFSTMTLDGNKNLKYVLKNSGISSGVFSPTFKKIASKKSKAKILKHPTKILAPWQEALKNQQELFSVTQSTQASKRIEGRILDKDRKGLNNVLISVYAIKGFESQVIGQSDSTPEIGVMPATFVQQNKIRILTTTESQDDKTISKGSALDTQFSKFKGAEDTEEDSQKTGKLELTSKSQNVYSSLSNKAQTTNTSKTTATTSPPKTTATQSISSKSDDKKSSKLTSKKNKKYNRRG
ncbi:MAG: hypothetical protein ACTSR8_06510 [Promethearchaeota archaeon]